LRDIKIRQNIALNNRQPVFYIKQTLNIVPFTMNTMQKTSYETMKRPSAEQFALQTKMPVAVVLDDVRSAGNVGAFFRTADAFAAEIIVLCGITATPPSKEIHKTALGAELTVRWEHCSSTARAIAALKASGYRIIAVEQVLGAVPLNEFVPEPGVKYALVFGNEVDGVGQDALDVCEGAIEIPQAGTKHSLNVAVSGGAVLWYFFSHYLNRL
jgi:tRNA G18 (ribose-2'-O)-methylase SpoU